MNLKHFVFVVSIFLCPCLTLAQETSEPPNDSQLMAFEQRLKDHEAAAKRFESIGYGGAVLQSDLKLLAAKVARLRDDIRTYKATHKDEAFDWKGAISFSLKSSIRQAKRCGPKADLTNGKSGLIATQGDAVSFNVALEVKEDNIPPHVAFYYLTALDGDPGAAAVEISGGKTKQFNGDLLVLGTTKIIKKGRFGGPFEIGSKNLPDGQYAFAVKIVDLKTVKQTKGQAIHDASPVSRVVFRVAKEAPLNNKVSDNLMDVQKLRITVPRKLMIGEKKWVDVHFPDWFTPPVKLDVKTTGRLSHGTPNIQSNYADFRLASSHVLRDGQGRIELTATDKNGCAIKLKRDVAISARPDFSISLNLPHRVKSGDRIPFRFNMPEVFSLEDVIIRKSEAIKLSWRSESERTKITGTIIGEAPENISRKTQLEFWVLGYRSDDFNQPMLGKISAEINIDGPLNIPEPIKEVDNSDDDLKEFFAGLHQQTQQSLNEYRQMKNKHEREMAALRKKKNAHIGLNVNKSSSRVDNNKNSYKPEVFFVQCQRTTKYTENARVICPIGSPETEMIRTSDPQDYRSRSDLKRMNCHRIHPAPRDLQFNRLPVAIYDSNFPDRTAYVRAAFVNGFKDCLAAHYLQKTGRSWK